LPRFQHAILFAEKRDHFLLFTLALAKQDCYGKLKGKHGCSLRQSSSIRCRTLRPRTFDQAAVTSPSHDGIASMSGCSRETVSRAMKTLLASGHVTEIHDGLAFEQRAIREYLLPTMQNLVPKP
jgi:hypothetical protein